MSEPLDAILRLHRLASRTQCGAVSIPLVHHHAAERDGAPGPLRQLRCSKDVGHDGPHKDAICCWSFQTFEDWQVLERQPRAFDSCAADNAGWPCPTIRALHDHAAQHPEGSSDD